MRRHFELEALLVRDQGPVSASYVPLPTGLTVLYGLNGAGKTTLLAALEACLTGTPVEYEGVGLLLRARGPDDITRPLLEAWFAAAWTADHSWAPPDEPPELETSAAEILRAAAEDSLMDTVHRFLGDDALPEVASEVSSQRRYVIRPGNRPGSFVVMQTAIPSDQSPLVDQLVSAIRFDCAERPYGDFYPEWATFDPLSGDHPYAHPHPPVLCLWDTGKQFSAEALARVITDRDVDTTRRTLAFFRAVCSRAGQDLVERGSGSLSEFAHQVALQLEALARDLLSEVLLDAPPVHLVVHDIDQWFEGRSVEWRAGTARGDTVPLSSLSRAERRWANTAVAFAAELLTDIYRSKYPEGVNVYREGSMELAYILAVEPAPLVLILDEPEAALHRSAEAHMAGGLAAWAKRCPGHIVVASHSPEVLDLPEAQLLHVARRDQPFADVLPLTAPTRTGLLGFGLAPSDLLRRRRAFLLVEGQHEDIILQELLGDELQQARVDVLPLRGGKELPATIDSQFLFHYTDAHVVAMLDAVSAGRIATTWKHAVTLSRQTDYEQAGQFLRQQLPGKQPEQKWLREFLSLSLQRGLETRVTPFGLTAGDIVEYLPVSVLVPGQQSWSVLRARHAKEGGGTPFKTWLTKRYGADFTHERIRAAARAMDVVPSEFVALGELCRTLPRSGV